MAEISLSCHSRQLDQLSKKLRSFLDLLGCFSFRSAFASIWRMRSRVTQNCWPTSSSVWSVFMSMPSQKGLTGGPAFAAPLDGRTPASSCRAFVDPLAFFASPFTSLR